MNFFSWMVEFLTSRWSPLAFIITACGVIYANILGCMDKIADLVLAIDGLVRPVVSELGVNCNVLSFVNYVIPLDLVVAYLNLYLPFLAACATIRFIKSWIPTIS